jgi:hypothetical protein
MEPFGWFIETGQYRWFTQDSTSVSMWRGRKDAKVTVLFAGPQVDQPLPVEASLPVKECEHEPDVLKRCVKCGKDLNII